MSDFERLEICFPEDRETQKALIRDVIAGRINQRQALTTLKQAILRFSDVIDGRSDEEYEGEIECDDDVETE